MELVGRAHELAGVDAAVADAVAGAPRAIGVLGEAGIGKTALMHAVRERADAAGMLVLTGRAAEHERSVPFGLAVDALDDHVATLHPRRVQSVGPDLAAVLPAAAEHAETRAEPAAGAAERFRYHRAVRALLELLGRERPVALLLDDLHWADDASVELVLHLLRRPPRGPHLLAVAMRPQDPAPRVLDAARDMPGWAHLQPGPLGDDAAHTLVAGIPDAALRDRVVREAGGNPLFLEELRRVARDPADALPPTLLAAVGLEIGMLPPASRALIEGAAVAGDPFDPDVAARAADHDPAAITAALDRLVAADLVRPAGPGRDFAFRHPLVRRAVYDAAPPGWRIAAHERAAAALAERGAGPAVRAHHVERSARQGDMAAVEVLTAAAVAAADTAPAAAARWYAAALRVLPDADLGGRAALLGPLALAQGAAGELEAACATLDEVLGLMPPEPTELRVRLIAAAAMLESMLGRTTQMRRRLLAAVEVTPAELRAPLESVLAYSEYNTGEYAAMAAWAESAIEHAGADEPMLRAGAEALAGLSTMQIGDPERGHLLVDAALSRLAGASDASVAARIDDAFLVSAGALLGELPADGIVAAGRTIAVARATRQDRIVPMIASIRSMLHQHGLRLDEALADAETATESARLLGHPGQLFQPLMTQSNIHWLRGEQTAAARLREECLVLCAQLEPTASVITAQGNAASQFADEDPERCIRDMTAVAGPMLERADQSWGTFLLGRVVLAGIALGRFDDAERWADRIAELAALTRLPGSTARAGTARAELLLAAGDPAAAAARAGDAAAGAEAAALLLDAAAARLCEARALAAAGEREAAVALLQRIAADASQGSAGFFVDAAGRELRRLGSRLSASTRRAADAPRDGRLTEREEAIAALVAAGRSNKQVAAELFVSDKTVEAHLSRIYAKLGVRSRVELAAMLTASA